jgi:hypothetical protein
MGRLKHVIHRGLIGVLLLWCAMLAPGGPLRHCPADASSHMVLETSEVAGDTDAREAVLTADDVEEARTLTRARLYGLAGLWLLIAVAVVLIRLQVRDDERLYRAGYYPVRED